MDEPSVLDYVLEKLAFWRKSTVSIPAGEDIQKPRVSEPAGDQAKKDFRKGILILLPPLFAIFAQVFGEPYNRSKPVLIFLYIVATGSLLLLIRFRIWYIEPLKLDEGEAEDFTVRWPQFLIGSGYGTLAFLFFLGNQFNIINISFWIFSLVMIWGSIDVSMSDETLGKNKIGWQRFLYGVGLQITRWKLLVTALFILVVFFLGYYRSPSFDEIIGDIFVILIFWSIRVPETWWVKVKSAWKHFWAKGIQITPWGFLVAGVFLLAVIYRFYALDQVPPEMFSDHAEKLIDVTDVLRGDFFIFFPRNTGREAIQMYLTAAIAKIFGTGISFLSLKLGTSLAGLFTLPFIYLLGKEIQNREVGLLAMFFAGVAYWPNVISRVALRFALHPVFAVPTLFFLIRGLKRKRWSDFLCAGLALGLGLHGYSPFRIVPVVVVVTLLIYFLNTSSINNRRQAVFALLLVGLISLVIFLPLLRFATTEYDLFSYRMLTRLTDFEHPLSGSPASIFFSNLWKSLIMFQWDNGNIWVHSVTGRPALGIFSAALFSLGVFLILVRTLRNWPWMDLVLGLLILALLILPLDIFSAGLFSLGIILIVVRNRRNWHWMDLILLLLILLLLILPLDFLAAGIFILAALLILGRNREYWHWLDVSLILWIPLMLLPSVLSIAFPDENPALSRAGGAIIPVFIVIGIAVENIYTNLKSRLSPHRAGKWVTWGLVLLLMVGTAKVNADIVFDDYYQQFKKAAWNTSEIGEVIAHYSETIGDKDHAWVVPYPHWVDTRLVGIHAIGQVKDFALFQHDIQGTSGISPPKLYIYKPDDQETYHILRDMYPDGINITYQSETEGRDFILFYVLQ